MTAFRLKIIAILAMTIDHIGYVLLDNNIYFRMVGRLTFPILAFMIANGYRHTRNHNNYLIRLLTFALISEPIYNLFLKNNILYLGTQNIFFTLFLGLLAITVFEKYKDINYNSAVLMGLMITGAAYFLKSDYGFLGALLIFAIHFAFNSNYKIAFVIIGFNLSMVVLGGAMIIQLFGILGLLPILLYNQKPGYKSGVVKISLYVFYPLHLFVIYIVARVIGVY